MPLLLTYFFDIYIFVNFQKKKKQILYFSKVLCHQGRVQKTCALKVVGDLIILG